MNKIVTFSTLSDEFIAVRKITRKKGTTKNDRSHIKYIKEWLERQGLSDHSFKRIDRYHWEQFSLYLARSSEDGGKGLDRGSSLKYYDTLCNLYNFAVERGLVEERPLNLYKFPVQREDHSAQLVPEEKLAELLTEMQTNDYQLFVGAMLLLACALRPRTELRLRKVGDFDLKQGFVRVPVDEAKVHKSRIVTIPQYMVKILADYGVDKADKDLYLFGVNHAIGTKHISENMFCYRFNKYRDKLGISKEVSFYSLKGNGGKLFLEACNGNVVALMEHFGHTKLTTTQRYVSKKLGLVNTKYQQNAIDPRTLKS